MTGADENQGPPAEDDFGIEQEPMDVEQPRRSASAQFAVPEAVGSAAALREAMDPANQSLAEALRLSFRVLQVVILVLVGLFLLSGFQTVEKGQSGVMLQFGRIVTVGDHQAMEPGLQYNPLPFPAGEFVIFDVENRSIDLGGAFWPNIPANLTLDQAIDRAAPRSPLQPGHDGSVLTADGDLAHTKVNVSYQIIDPVRFVRRLRVDEASVDRVVDLATRRAVVHAAARLDLQELVDNRQAVAGLIKESAQGILDDLDCGIQLTEVTLPDTRPPLAIVKAYGELQNAREEARQGIEKARQDAEQTLIDAAGPDYARVAALINEYEEAQDLGDEDESAARLARINDFLESDSARGEIAEVILRAESYESQIELTLGSEARRFASILPHYRRNPELITKRRWLQAYNLVLNRDDVEIFYVPPDLGTMDLSIFGSDDVQKLRRQEMLRRKEQKAMIETTDSMMQYFRRADSYELGESNPVLEVEGGKIRAKGAGK